VCKARHVTPAGPRIASFVLKCKATGALKDAQRGSFVSFTWGCSVAEIPLARATLQRRPPSNPFDRMLGYPIVFIDRMLRVNGYLYARTRSVLRPLLAAGVLLALALSAPHAALAQQTHPSSTAKGGIANLEAKTQGRKGDITTADGDVDIHYEETRLRADHVEYNTVTYEAVATGHVLLDYGNEHIEATEAHYNISTGHGLFHNVHGTIKVERQPNPNLLISDNPLYFEARDVERFAGDIYLVHRAWITICDPKHPKWQFYAPNARIRLNKTVAFVNANFRLFRVPLLWLPYASAPAGEKIRQTGVLIPDIGQSSRKGFILGDAFYLAPNPWMDATMGLQFMSRRGFLERGEFRAKPFENTSIDYTYFGVDDRGIVVNGLRTPQGGEQQRLEIQSLLPGGWRFVTDYNHLSSLTFRLAFADTFGDATNSEVRTAVFLTNNFRGFSLNFAGLDDKSFLTLPVAATSTTPAVPATSVTLRNLPEVRFGSVEQSPWRNVPVYFGFDAFADVVYRSDQFVQTSNFVDRYELAPRVTVPLHFGPWLGVTTSAAFRTTSYGASYNSTGLPTPNSIHRDTGEFSVELRPPTLERFFDRTSLKKNKTRRRYKHTIEPAVTYRYVTGVNHFADFIQFDSDSTLTDTNEVEYGITQRLFRKDGDDQPQELISWQLVQKHYFDPTFGGAIADGQRNVLQATDSITPFAFTFGPRNWSPIVSDFKVTPGGPYDLEQILEYDPQVQRLVTIGTLVKVKPFSEFFTTLAFFRLNANPALADLPVNPPPGFVAFQQPLSSQIRALVGYGSETRKGFNLITGVGYDFENKTLQNQIVQASYNGGCCGLAVEYRRINLGQVRSENQFRVSFIVANIGTFGNLRHQEKIF
jgi:LPS-assembly protein